jgi:EVE domain
MNTWLFQSVPEHFDLREGLREGKADTWRVSRYRSQIKPGDTVLFWMGGPPEVRGMYGWGEITDSPRYDPNDEQFGVKLVYRRRFDRPLLASEIRKIGKLDQMLIFRAPFGTNFQLTEDEVETIRRLLPASDRPRF